MKRLFRKFNNVYIIGALGILLLGSCVSQKNVTMLQEKISKEMTTDFINTGTSTYRIQTGDHLYIRVNSIDPKTSKFFQTDFPYLMNSTYQYLNTYAVDENGYVSFSFIEKMQVAGSTVQFYANPATLFIGASAAIIVSLIAMWLTIRRQVSRPARELLAGNP